MTGTVLRPQTGPRASTARVGAMVLRHWYVALVLAAHRRASSTGHSCRC